ncbi:hypothetical protein [Acaryochloris marina]|uniref:hypothetical protein n=1 Tax=Acaryochloris marina TaxID=155978 RepID=UPI001BAE86EF|nr:hypothetical protein [Acaryochloris marina]QUY45524.1 hypothetical protein I1H34_27605 [Acaryochloris marina S15]
MAQAELIWYTELMKSTDEDAFQVTIHRFLTEMDAAAQATGHLDQAQLYVPASVTTDGWVASQNAWISEVGLDLIECKLHGQKRVSATFDDFSKTHPDWLPDQLQQLKDDFDSVLNASSLASYSQRVRRNRERYGHEPTLLKRLDILKHKRFLFTNHLKHKDASAYSAPLDRSMRFLDKKLIKFGQYRAEDAINPMVNAWAIVNNLRQFLPDAKKAGQSLAEHFGVQLKGMPWMEALNLCTMGSLDIMLAPTF